MKTKQLVYASFLLTIALLLGGLFERATGIPLSLRLELGVVKLTLDFTIIPLALSGIWLGPIWALMVGFGYDQIAFLLNGGGAWNPIFTLADMAVCVLPALIYMLYRHFNIKKPIYSVAFSILVAYFVFGFLMTSQLVKGLVGNQFKLLIAIYLVLLVISAIILYVVKNNQETGYYTYEKLFIAIFIGAFTRSMISAFGLYMMFGLKEGVTLVYFIAPRLISVLILSFMATGVMRLLRPVLTKYLSH